jgi:hypothetical protein
MGFLDGSQKLFFSGVTLTKIVEAALQHLKDLIDKGIEFPEAEFQTSIKFNLSPKNVDDLRNAYDRDCAGQSYD